MAANSKGASEYKGMVSMFFSDDLLESMFTKWADIHWKSFKKAGLENRYYHEFDRVTRKAYISNLEVNHPRIWQRIRSAATYD